MVEPLGRMHQGEHVRSALIHLRTRQWRRPLRLGVALGACRSLRKTNRYGSFGMGGRVGVWVAAVVMALWGGVRQSRAEPPPTDNAPGAGVLPLSRIFTMPTAHVVGAYQMRTAGDASLLEQPGRLTSAGLVAVGIGELAQLEYRHSEAIGVTGVNAPVPAVGVVVRLPLPTRPWLPAIAVALRLGVWRAEAIDKVTLSERVSDLYAVVSKDVHPQVMLALGARVASAELSTMEGELSRVQVLPTGGWQWRLAPHASLLGELGAAPQFRFDPDTAQRQIDYAVIGRLGYRWWIRPWFALDGSVGYQAQLRVGDATQWRELVAWDIRLGTEVNIDWGHAACRGLAVLCRR